MASNQIPPSAPSPAIGIYTDPGLTPTFLVTVLVTVANMPSSPLIAQTNGLIAFIHRGSGAVCHSYSLSVIELLGGSSDLRATGSSMVTTKRTQFRNESFDLSTRKP
jgi:hypothetical protein